MFNLWRNAMTTNFANFYGRARRKELWAVIIFNHLITFLALIATELCFYIPYGSVMFIMDGLIEATILLTTTFMFMIPTLATSVRRLHDIGKSGWWVLPIFIPVINLCIVLLMGWKDSEPGENQYGPYPKDC